MSIIHYLLIFLVLVVGVGTFFLLKFIRKVIKDRNNLQKKLDRVKKVVLGDLREGIIVKKITYTNTDKSEENYQVTLTVKETRKTLNKKVHISVIDCDISCCAPWTKDSRFLGSMQSLYNGWYNKKSIEWVEIVDLREDRINEILNDE